MAQREQDPLEHFFLTGNPNPNRIGCPSQELLQLVARRKLDVPKEVFAHLAQCSECSVDVKAYRLRFERRRSRTNILFAGGLLAAGVTGGVVLMVVPQVNLFHSKSAHIQGAVRKTYLSTCGIKTWSVEVIKPSRQSMSLPLQSG